jgi:sialidase-1
MMPYLTLTFIVLLVLCLVMTTSAEALFEEINLVKKPKGDHGYRGMMGDFLQLKDGSLLFSYTDGDIKVIRSTDQGQTWGEPRVLVKAPPRGYIAHPSFLRLRSGAIMSTYIYSTHPATPYFAHNYYRLSTDEGQTWSDQFCYTAYPGYLLVHNDRLSTLSTGRILAVAEYKMYMPSTEDHSGYVGMSFYSDDEGLSWHPSANTVDMYGSDKVEVQEADAVELKDGRLLMFARTYSGWPVFAYSEDKGATWGPPIPRKDIKMPYAGLPTVRRLPSTGDLLFIWISERSQDKEKPQVHRRCTLTAAISQDEGQTFVSQRNIASNPEDDFGYQAVEFLPDGTVLVGYHCREGLRLARIGVDWFYGK